MEIKSFTVGPFAENTYLLVKEEKALLVDPGFYEKYELNDFTQELEKQSSELLAVVLTHAHLDHVLGLSQVLDVFDVPVYLSDKDRYLWNNVAYQAQMFGLQAESFEIEPEPVPIINEWNLGPFTFEVRYTPGHAPDHIVLYSEEYNLLIAGDTLFRQGIGRYDLYKGDSNVLEKSIREKLYSLPDQTEVFPGHGPKTTIGYEKENNPFVSIRSDQK